MIEKKDRKWRNSRQRLMGVNKEEHGRHKLKRRPENTTEDIIG